MRSSDNQFRFIFPHRRQLLAPTPHLLARCDTDQQRSPDIFCYAGGGAALLIFISTLSTGREQMKFTR